MTYKLGVVLSYHVEYFSARYICHSERYERYISWVISWVISPCHYRTASYHRRGPHR